MSIHSIYAGHYRFKKHSPIRYNSRVFGVNQVILYVNPVSSVSQVMAKNTLQID